MTQNFICQAQPVTNPPPEVRQYSSEARRSKTGHNKTGALQNGAWQNPRLQHKPEDGGSTHPTHGAGVTKN